MVAQAPIGAVIGGTPSAGRLGREPNRPGGWVIRLIGGFGVGGSGLEGPHRAPTRP
jgi:hypothetical protein